MSRTIRLMLTALQAEALLQRAERGNLAPGANVAEWAASNRAVEKLRAKVRQLDEPRP
jgi:hypothetical protein